MLKLSGSSSDEDLAVTGITQVAIIGIGHTGASRALRLDRRLLYPATLVLIDQEGQSGPLPQHATRSAIHRLLVPRDSGRTAPLEGPDRVPLIEELKAAIGDGTPMVLLVTLNSAVSRTVLRQILDNLRNPILWSETNYSALLIPRDKQQEGQALFHELQARSMGFLIRNFEEAYSGLYSWADADRSPLDLVQNLWEVAAHCVDDYMGALISRTADLERNQV